MKIDLHIHSKDCSDGKLPLTHIFKIAHERGIRFMSITDHDSVECQEKAIGLAKHYGINYLTGVELNIRFSSTRYNGGKSISLDLLGYGFDPHNEALRAKTSKLRDYRQKRARLILERLNNELNKQGIEPLEERDMAQILKGVDGALGRPHIARYLVAKGVVKDVQDAFDKFLVRCDVPKMPLQLEEASQLIREAGGKAVLAHGNDPNGTSLASLTPDVSRQLEIIEDEMLRFLDGLECWHSRHGIETTEAYRAFSMDHGLVVTGGSDCHQNPVRIGMVNVPPYVIEQFDFT